MRLIDALSKIDYKLMEHQASSLKLLLGQYYSKYAIHRYFHPFLCYCPECMKVGYHAWFHQSIFANECPIHHIPLQYTCPKCKQPILLDLVSNRQNYAYSCKCGYNLLNACNSSEILSKWFSQNIASQLLRCDYEKLSLSHRKFVSLYYYDSLELKSYKRTYIPLNDGVTVAKITTTSLEPSKLVLSEKERLMHFIFLYKSTLKGIAKHLRKMIPKMSSRIKYLKKAITYNFPTEIIPSKEDIGAYTYLMWRRDIEGHLSYQTVHSSLESSSCASGLEGYNNLICNSMLFQYF